MRALSGFHAAGDAERVYCIICPIRPNGRSEKEKNRLKLNIVLVEPQIPQNTGNISRTCAVTGAVLHLVGPMGFVIEDKKLKRAGLDYWDKLDIRYYESLDDFFRKNPDGPFFYFTTKGRHLYSEAAYPDGAYLVFGREDKGLPEPLLKANEASCVRLPMRPTLRSLNLSNTVAIAAYEVLRQWGFPDMEREGELHTMRWED